jgi:protein-S-isoprenylcysteine O-methyltransferase Ste14
MAILLFGAASYVVFLAAFLSAIGFVEGVVAPRTIDGGAQPASVWGALAIDAALLLLFALPHSGMARAGYKQRLTQIVPPAAERSVYVLVSSVLLLVLCWFWRPVPQPVWNVENAAGRALLRAIGAAGWLTVLLATFMIDHFELFGLKQVWQNWRGDPQSPPRFKTPGLYRFIRHPIMLGFLVAFWAAPSMSVGRLLFAVATTGYILIAIQLEERDLERLFGETYREYRRRVPMLLPLLRQRGRPVVR